MAAAEILNACLEKNDEASWLAFVECFQPVIAGGVTRVVRRFAPANRALVDDLVQDTYLKLVRDRSRILREFTPQHENSIYGFLNKVADGVAKDYYRALTTKKRGAERPDDGSGAEAVTPPEAIEAAAFLDELERHLQQHESPRDCSIFWMYHRVGYSAREIAELPGVGLSQKGVEACLYRMMRVLREFVQAIPAGIPARNPLGEVE